MGRFGRFGGTKNGTSGARIKIPRPLLAIYVVEKPLLLDGVQMLRCQINRMFWLNDGYKPKTVTRPCTTMRDSENIHEQSSLQKYTTCWVFLAFVNRKFVFLYSPI